MLYIRIYVESIGIAGTRFEKCKFDVPNELVMRYGGAGLPVESLRFHYRLDAATLFPYLDDLEWRMPKAGHSLWWDWAGVRRGTEYYIELNVTALSEAVGEFMAVFRAVFTQSLEETGAFEWPEVDAPFQFDSQQAGEETEAIDCDEDDKLRQLEAFTSGNEYIQWSRMPQEFGGGAGVATILGVAAGLASFGYTFVMDFRDRALKRHYSKKIEDLLKIVVKACGNKGRFVLPEPEPPEIFNAATREYEYEFTQILADGRRRKIYVGEDGENITKQPFHGPGKSGG